MLCAIMGIDSNIKGEKDTEYIEWNKRGITPWALAASELLNSTIYSPIAEELTFRLVLMKVICIQHLKLTSTAANVVQAIVFGLMHMSNSVYTTQTQRYTSLQTLSCIISGLVSGYVYIRCNSLLPSLIAHAVNNGAAGINEVVGYIKYRSDHPIKD